MVGALSLNAMKVTVKRVRQGKYSTLSEIRINNRFICYGLEDMIREDKIWGATAIPTGRYRLGLRRLGGMHARYLRLYPSFHQGMLQLLEVPNFDYIYFHQGNNIGDTSGCILVGDRYKSVDKDYELRKSASAYKRLYNKLLKSVVIGEVEVEVVNCLIKKKDEKGNKEGESGAADGTDGSD